MDNITVEELKRRLDAGEKLNIVDVREPHENADFNIGGVLIPLGQIQSMQIDEIEDLKDKEVILYCRSGNRSGQACMFLDAMGFKNTKKSCGRNACLAGEDWRMRTFKNNKVQSSTTLNFRLITFNFQLKTSNSLQP